LETRRGVLFWVLEVQNWFVSMILLVSQQLRFGKNCNPLWQHAKNDHNNRKNACPKKKLWAKQ
jgi:hypothetical protein